MGAMDYITSANICYLICDTLKLIDKRPIDHGIRVAYMMMKMLQCKGGYDEYEIAEFAFLAMIHDIGVYKTDELTDEFLYDTEENGNAHAAYGAIFLSCTSPFGDRTDIIRYHHLPYRKLSGIKYKYGKIAMYLSLLEDVDAVYRKEGAGMDYKTFEAGAGKCYLPEAVLLLTRCIRIEGMLEQFATGKYEEELHTFMHNALFTNEEKENYIKFVMHCFSLGGKMRTVRPLLCCCIVDEIAASLEIVGREKEKLEYAAMLHDIGMLRFDKTVIKAAQKMETAAEALRDHVKIGTDLLNKYFDVEGISEIVAAHHEHLNGKGYPNGLMGDEITESQRVLQVADFMTMHMVKDHMAMDKNEILELLVKCAENRELGAKAVKGVIDRYDEIEKRIQSETRTFLEMHVRIKNSYKVLTGESTEEKV